MAWNQGIDLYGCDDNRLLKGFEYVAKWNLGHGVPYTAWTWKYGAPDIWSGSQNLTAPSADSRGALRPIRESIYHHYVNCRGIDTPYVAEYAKKVRPEGGGFDQLGFGTLAFSRPKAIVSAETPVPSQGATVDTGTTTAAEQSATDRPGGPGHRAAEGISGNRRGRSRSRGRHRSAGHRGRRHWPAP
ncbi:hypothetical protein ACH4VT_23840 [Streptomyces lydicus]|uniref:hypothetical protein n=1 Tax=Streptomyces lydicus TaxID=47763 RepID=UPI0037B4AF97